MALHNKFRPKLFGQVFGQDHVTRVFLNAANSNRLCEYQALLFIGTRGSGKTTTARIIAHQVNCTDLKNGEPCYQCDACAAVSRALEHGGDVIEMDAASKGGVADVERIIESCHYQPVVLRKKVFIIDEAHQLSPQAKDALLKTLEEPPSHVLFILATTEAHKIPPTIGSRCIKFVFKDGDVKSIASYLRIVIEKHGRTYEEQALQRIATLASGSYREALGLLEKIMDVSDSITSTALDDTLCLPGQDTVIEAVKACLAGDQAKCVAIVSEVLEQGKDVRLFLREVVQAMLRGTISLAERGASESMGLKITDILDVATYIFSKSTSYSSELGGLVPGLVLAGAAGEAATRRAGAIK